MHHWGRLFRRIVFREVFVLENAFCAEKGVVPLVSDRTDISHSFRDARGYHKVTGLLHVTPNGTGHSNVLLRAYHLLVLCAPLEGWMATPFHSTLAVLSMNVLVVVSLPLQHCIPKATLSLRGCVHLNTIINLHLHYHVDVEISHLKIIVKII